MRRREFIAGLGATVTWPVAARGQRAALPVIGFLDNGTEDGVRELMDGFRQGLAEQGYVVGRNVELLPRYSQTQSERLPALAADLVRHQVAVIFVAPNVGFARIAMDATRTIPIVFAAGGDPVDAGLVVSLNRPGGNITGVTFLAVRLVAKRLEIIHQIVPTARSIGYLINPSNPQLEFERSELETAVDNLGMRLIVAKASSADEFETAIASLIEQNVGAMLPGADSLFYIEKSLLVALAARYAIPTIYIGRDFASVGGLVSYGGDALDAFRIAGRYVGRILNGEKPADLPVQQTTAVEMVINLKTAKALGLTVPLPLLARADEIIE